jgi:serine/threonine protein kinase
MELNPDQDKRCDEIVEQAVALAPELRRDFVVREASGDQAVLNASLQILDLISTDLPTDFGGYEVIQHLGSGGMGDVYLARDPDIDRLVAIKVLKDWGALVETRRRFIAEARTLGKIDHPNVIKIFNCFPREKRPYFVMEYVKGESLASAIRNKRCEDFRQRVAIARQIADAVRAVHETGTLHRDIKTENVILTPDGVPKLLDFGIARAETNAITDPSLRIGTLANLPPEVIAGEPASIASDIYAYGLLLFELFTDVVPFEGNRRELLDRILGQGVALNVLGDAHLPREIEELIRRSTAQEPRHRPADFQDIIAAFDRVPRAAEARERHPTRGLTLVLVTVGVLLFLTATVAFLYRSAVLSTVPQRSTASPVQINEAKDLPTAPRDHADSASTTKKRSDAATVTNKNRHISRDSSASQPSVNHSDSPVIDTPVPVTVAELPSPVSVATTPPDLTAPMQQRQQIPTETAIARENPKSEKPAADTTDPATDHAIDNNAEQRLAVAPPAPTAVVTSYQVTDDREQDRREVRAVLERLADAYRNRSVSEIFALWPTLQGNDRQTLSSSLSQAKTVNFELTPREQPQLFPELPIETRPDKATVRCWRVMNMTVNRGEPPAALEGEVVVRLERQGGAWKIVDIRRE